MFAECRYLEQLASTLTSKKTTYSEAFVTSSPSSHKSYTFVHVARRYASSAMIELVNLSLINPVKISSASFLLPKNISISSIVNLTGNTNKQ